MKCEHALCRRAETQVGLIAKFQLYDIDLTPPDWWRARRSARWEELTPRVLRHVGSPESQTQRALAAVLDSSPGGMLHATSALAWQGVGGYTLSKIHTTPSDRESDKVRYQRFNDAGYTVAVIWENDLWRHPQDVVSTMIDARECARRNERVVLHTPSCPWPD